MTSNQPPIFELQKQLRRSPQQLSLYFQLAQRLLDQALAGEAIEVFHLGLNFHPQNQDLMYGKGFAYEALKQNDKAILEYQEVLKIGPHFSAAFRLGECLKSKNLSFQAAQAYEQAFQTNPHYFPALTQSIEALYEVGEIQKVQDILSPFLNGEIYNSAWFKGHTHPAQNEIKIWAQRAAGLHLVTQFSQSHFSSKNIAQTLIHLNQALPQSSYRAPKYYQPRTKVVFISNEINHNTPSLIYRPLFQSLNRNRYELIMCADSTEGVISNQLKPFFSEWIPTQNLSNPELFQKLKSLQANILVDLCGIMNIRRFPVFAEKPIYKQITAGSNPVFTSGLKQFDYLMSDPVLTPKSLAQNYPEKIFYGHSFIHRTPPESYPIREKSQNPSEKLIFGSANTLNKYTPQVLSTWGKILKALPHAHLKLKTMAFQDSELKKHFRTRLSSAGVPQNQVELLSPESNDDHIPSFYNQIDIALDPFPYNGAIGTIEALWMGVPVLTLASERHVGESVLRHCGCEEFLASNLTEYIQMAIEWGQNLERLNIWRRELRRKVYTSVLLDGKLFAQDWERLFEQALSE